MIPPTIAQSIGGDSEVDGTNTPDSSVAFGANSVVVDEESPPPTLVDDVIAGLVPIDVGRGVGTGIVGRVIDGGGGAVVVPVTGGALVKVDGERVGHSRACESQMHIGFDAIDAHPKQLVSELEA
jgi:hypothetical protein